MLCNLPKLRDFQCNVTPPPSESLSLYVTSVTLCEPPDPVPLPLLACSPSVPWDPYSTALPLTCSPLLKACPSCIRGGIPPQQSRIRAFMPAPTPPWPPPDLPPPHSPHPAPLQEDLRVSKEPGVA